MRKFLIFVVVLFYASLAKAVANSIINLGEFSIVDPFQPGSLLLALVESSVILHIARRRCDVQSTAYSQLHASVEWWAKGVILLVGAEFVVAILVGGISMSVISTTGTLLWENTKLYALMVAPVAIWGGRLAQMVWVGS